MGAQKDDDLFFASLTIAEIQRGILEKPPGRKRSVLDAWFTGPEGPPALFAGRILPFDERAGLLWACLMADGKAAGRPRSALDTIIASIAAANDCIVVTANETDFVDIAFVNPLRGDRDEPTVKSLPPAAIFIKWLVSAALFNIAHRQKQKRPIGIIALDHSISGFRSTHFCFAGDHANATMRCI